MAITLWGISVAVPVWETRSENYGEWGTVIGALPAIIGFLGVLVLCPAWFANLLLVPAIVTLFKRRRVGLWLSLAAFAIAASAYAMPALYGDNDKAVIVGRKIGFYLWLGSFLVIFLAHCLLLDRDQAPAPPVRWALIVLIIFSLLGLEVTFRVGLSPLEAALKEAGPSAFAAALARNPTAAEKDSALHWAIVQHVQKPGAETQNRIEQLVAAEANVNQADKDQTPLMRLARPGNESLVDILIRAGANVNARDYRGKTILDIARERSDNAQCEKMLIGAGATASAGQAAVVK
jgi:hypothetical protein